MAKPINPTPTLYGKDAERFLKKMKETEQRKITAEERKIAQEIIKNRKYFKVQQPMKRKVNNIMTDIFTSTDELIEEFLKDTKDKYLRIGLQERLAVFKAWLRHTDDCLKRSLNQKTSGYVYFDDITHRKIAEQIKKIEDALK